MAQNHKCPCCLSTVWRREVKTCGSPECRDQWRSMSLSARAKMIESAESSFLDNPPLDNPKEMDPKLKKALSPSQLDPQAELLKIFGKKDDQ